MKLREFKVKQLTMINEIEKELVSKYPEKRERIQYIVEAVKTKLDNLRVFTLYDYLRTIDLVSREFPEFKRAFPRQEEIDELLKESP